jgi:hypothetical protein
MIAKEKRRVLRKAYLSRTMSVEYSFNSSAAKEPWTEWWEWVLSAKGFSPQSKSDRRSWPSDWSASSEELRYLARIWWTSPARREEGGTSAWTELKIQLVELQSIVTTSATKRVRALSKWSISGAAWSTSETREKISFMALSTWGVVGECTKPDAVEDERDSSLTTMPRAAGRTIAKWKGMRGLR